MDVAHKRERFSGIVYETNIWLGAVHGRLVKFDPRTEAYDSAVRIGRASGEALPLSDSTFLALAELTSGNKMEVRSLDGTVLDTLGSSPILKDSPSTILNNAFMQADYTLSPDGKRVAVACLTYEFIDIYDLSQGSAMRLTGPKDVPQRAEMTKHDFGYTFDQSDATAVYQNVVSNDDLSPYVTKYVL